VDPPLPRPDESDFTRVTRSYRHISSSSGGIGHFFLILRSKNAIRGWSQSRDCLEEESSRKFSLIVLIRVAQAVKILMLFDDP